MANMIETKEVYSAKIEAKIEQLNTKINEMKAQAKEVQADPATQYNDLIDDLCAKRDATQAKLQDLKTSSGEAWADLREGLERAWSEVSHAFDLATKHFK